VAGSEPGRRLVVGVTSELLAASYDVLGAIDDPLLRDDAVERLIGIAENGIAGLASFSQQRFQSFEATDVPEERAEASEDALVVALGELTIAQTLLGAAAATGQREIGAAGETANPDALQASLAAARTLPHVVEAAAGEPAPQSGAEPAQPESLRVVVDKLRRQVDETLDVIVAASVEAATKSLVSVLDLAPAAVRQAIAKLGEQLQLGKIANRLFSAALWALDQGLATIRRLIPVRSLDSVRAEIEGLCERLQNEGALDIAVAAILGVAAVDDYASQVLARPGLEAGRLSSCACELEALTGRFRHVTGVFSGIAVAISLIAAGLAIVNIVLPQVALVVAGAHLLVVAAVLVVGMDYVDVRRGPDMVPGVRSVLSAAVE